MAIVLRLPRAPWSMWEGVYSPRIWAGHGCKKSARAYNMYLALWPIFSKEKRYLDKLSNPKNYKYYVFTIKVNTLTVVHVAGKIYGNIRECGLYWESPLTDELLLRKFLFMQLCKPSHLAVNTLSKTMCMYKTQSLVFWLITSFNNMYIHV